MTPMLRNRARNWDSNCASTQRLCINAAHVVDPDTNTEYVLVRADVYARLAGLLGGDVQPSEAYPAVDRAFAEGWNDPRMDDYDRYEELRK